MNVRELIEALSQFDPEMRVMVDGYDEGYHDVKPNNLHIVSVKLNRWPETTWNGPHDEARIWSGEKADCYALVVSRQ